ncbi:MAG: hypothetical protein HC824_21865, partial [Synechococcales cyanobacterium RM1_1_8]|nr:hypothetical protein [Synechococcales cyanobacterium RM1_1_8]
TAHPPTANNTLRAIAQPLSVQSSARPTVKAGSALSKLQSPSSKNNYMATVVTAPSIVDGTTVYADASTSRYRAIERELQLAYAVGDRAHILLLEAEVERLTGWRFQNRRR